MSKGPEVADGDQIAGLIEDYDSDLASFIREEERLHQLAQSDPTSPDATVTFINDLAIPGRYQTAAYAQHMMRTAVPDMPVAQMEAEIGARMARANRYGHDPSRVFITERVLSLDVPDAAVCLRGLAALTRSRESQVICQILPDAAIAENRGGLALAKRRGIIMPGPNSSYVEPDDPSISLQEAQNLVRAADQHALSVEESLALIDQRVAGI